MRDCYLTNQNVRINNQSLNSGVYLITITNEKGEKFTKKMTKK
ncbi:MAG: T9SS type A sorting domain-containing protein [Tenuifilaceae bacterium]